MSVINAFNAVGKALKVLAMTEGAVRLAGTVGKREVSEEQRMDGEKQQRALVEEIEVETQHLVERVRGLLHQGNIRKLRIKDSKGKYLVEVPLTTGVVAGGVFVLATPTLAALSALAGLVANVKIEIVREGDPGDQ